MTLKIKIFQLPVNVSSKEIQFIIKQISRIANLTLVLKVYIHYLRNYVH